MAIEDVMEKFVGAFEKLATLVEIQQASLNEHARQIEALKFRLDNRERFLNKVVTEPYPGACPECEGKDCNCNGCGGFGQM